MSSFTFVVNRNRANIDIDNFHEFKTLKSMREFIDQDPSCPMEVSVFKNNVQVITIPALLYWQDEGKHPTLKQLIT